MQEAFGFIRANSADLVLIKPSTASKTQQQTYEHIYL